MPNYGLVVTPTYDPMSYEQYVAPFKDYAQVYNQMADAYDALEMEANQWEKLAGNDKDAPQYQQYLNYANSLRDAANKLATQGLNPKTRAAVSQARQRYAKEIKPIADAYQLRLDDIKAEDALLAKDPSLVLAQSARDRGLGEYMTGTPQRFGVSGEDVYQKAKAAFNAISSRKIDFDTTQRLFNNSYYALVKATGEADPISIMQKITEMTPEELEGSVGISKDVYQDLYEYARAVQDTLGRTHYNKLTDEGKAQIQASVLLGGNTGLVYDKDIKPYENWAAREAYRHKLNGEQPVDSQAPVERTTVILTNPNPEDEKAYVKLNSKIQKAIDKDVEYLASQYGVSTPSELRQAYISAKSESENATQLADEIVKNLYPGATVDYENFTIKGHDFGFTDRDHSNFSDNIIKFGENLGLTQEEILSVLGNVEIGYANTSNSTLASNIWNKVRDAAIQKHFRNTVPQNIRDAYIAKTNEKELEKYMKPYTLTDEEKDLISRYNKTEDDLWSGNHPTLAYDTKVTKLWGNNSAGTDFKTDLLGSISDNISGQKDIQIFEGRTGNGKKVKDKNVQDLVSPANVRDMYIDPETLVKDGLTLKSKDGKYYTIPLRYLDRNILDRLNAPVFSIGSNRMSLLELTKFYILKGEMEQAQQAISKIADVISAEYNYNFYQRQGNTQKL